MSARALARAIDVPPNRITEISHEQRDVTADTAIRLARYFGASAEFWLGLQKDYDLAQPVVNGRCRIGPENEGAAVGELEVSDLQFGSLAADDAQ